MNDDDSFRLIDRDAAVWLAIALTVAALLVSGA